MIVEEIYLKGCYLIKPRVFEDARGSFTETYHQAVFEENTGLKTKFVQDNKSVSKKGVLRGLHFQKGNHSQAKLVQVIKGEVMDVVVDIREGSPTFGAHYKIVLGEFNHYQLYIPRGFAHGFLTLTDEAIFAYKCDNYYNKEAESGIIYNDSSLNIDWELEEQEIILSEKDRKLPSLKALIS